MQRASPGPWPARLPTTPHFAARAIRGLRQFGKKALLWKLGASAAVLAAALWQAAVRPSPPFYDGLAFSTKVCASDGRVLKLLPASDGRLRLWHALSEFSPLLVRGTRIAESLEGKEPDAAIAQSLAARRFGQPGPDGPTFGRRARVTLESWRLRLLYSPDRLLEAYLNLSTYGPNIEGAGAASLIYFGKNPDQLTETEALELCVMPDHPVPATLTGQGSPTVLAARKQARRKIMKRLAHTSSRNGRQAS